MGGGGAVVVREPWAAAAGKAGKMGKVGADGAGVGSIKEQYWAPLVDPPRPFVPALPPVSAWSGTGVHVRMRHNLQVRPGCLGVCLYVCLYLCLRVCLRVCLWEGGLNDMTRHVVYCLYHVCNLFCSLTHFDQHIFYPTRPLVHLSCAGNRRQHTPSSAHRNRPLQGKGETSSATLHNTRLSLEDCFPSCLYILLYPPSLCLFFGTHTERLFLRPF